MNLGSSQEEIDRAIKLRDDSLAAASDARRREVRVDAPYDRVWFEAHRPLDVTGDGITDELRLMATGSNADSLQIILEVVVGRDTIRLAKWESDYELMDPPEGGFGSQARKDSLLRTRLLGVIADVSTSTGIVTKESIEWGSESCDGEVADCLRRRWGLTSIQGHDVAAEILAGPVPTVDFGYGYETSVSLAWVKSIQRFVGLASCC